MRFSENLNLPILQDGDKYSKEIQNEAFNTIDRECTSIKNTIKSALDIGEDVSNAIKTLGDISEELSDLKEKQNEDYYELLESNNYIGNKIRDIDSQLETIENKKNNEFFNLNNFKKLDNDVDDTDRIQRALDYCVENNLTLLIPHGEYIVSQRGIEYLNFIKGNRGYCIYKEDVKVNVLQLGTIIIDLSQADVRPNVFTFKNCQVKWSGGIFKGLNNTGNKKLYAGNSIVLDMCYNSIIDNIETYSTNGAPLLIECKNSIISNCYFENTSKNMGCCGAAFGIYGGEHNEIFKCISYGSTGDGDISLYGVGNNNKVTNSKCFNSLHDLDITNTGAQGICVDAGQNNCVVSECYVYGYYYGIDVKTNIENCLVINNTIERCKVSLALRYGEAGGNNIFTTFRGNTILNPYNGKDNIINNESYWCGIFVDRSYGVNIKDNIIIKSPSYNISEKGTGIVISSDVDTTDAYNKAITISNNTFYDQPSLASNTSPLIMDNIYIKLQYGNQNININDNNFTGGYGTKNNTTFIKIVKARCVNITNNLFGRIDNINGAISVCNAKVLNISNNSFKMCKGLIVSDNNNELNIVSNTFEGCTDWKSLITGTITGVCNFNSNIFKANSTNTGTLVSLVGGKKIISTNNILYMNRDKRNEFVLDSSIDNVINVNNYIEHIS